MVWDWGLPLPWLIAPSTHSPLPRFWDLQVISLVTPLLSCECAETAPSIKMALEFSLPPMQPIFKSDPAALSGGNFFYTSFLFLTSISTVQGTKYVLKNSDDSLCWTTPSRGLCAYDSFHPSFPSPIQSPPVAEDSSLEEQFTCLSTVKKTSLGSQSKGFVPQAPLRPLLDQIVRKVRKVGLAARLTQRHITLDPESWG